MGRADEYQFDYLDDNSRFADQVNGVLFQGRQVVKPDELKPFVPNYRLNLYDCHEHDTFHEFHSGLRQLFEVVRYGKDKEKLREIMEENREAYSRMDSDTRQLLEVVAKFRVKEEYTVMENGEKKYDLCKAFVDMKLEGIIEGKKEGRLEGRLEGKLEGKAEERQEHLIRTVCIKLRKNKPAATIADELEEELSAVERVIEAQRKAGCYDVERICAVLAE